MAVMYIFEQRDLIKKGEGDININFSKLRRKLKGGGHVVNEVKLYIYIYLYR